MVELQLKKLKIDKTGKDDGPIEESDGFIISDRNELMKKLLKKLYLLYWNDFISVEAFSSHIQAKYNIIADEEKALRIINIGRKLYQRDYYL